MKHFFVSTLITSFILVASHSAFAASEQFVPVYTDANIKLSWSRALPGKYSNGCVDTKGSYDRNKCSYERGTDAGYSLIVKDSAAAEACRSIGAKLPTESEFKSLIRNFDHTNSRWSPTSPQLTDKGKEAMQSVFGDMKGSFWSSSVETGVLYGEPNVAAIFDGLDGDMGYYSRESSLSVLCVSSLSEK